MGDGAEIGDQFFMGHADAAVGDGDGLFLVIDRDVDLQRGIGIEDLLLQQFLVPEFFQGIGRIGNQLPQKDLPLGVERMDDDIQQLIDFRLKFLGFGFGFFRCHVVHLVLFPVG